MPHRGPGPLRAATSRRLVSRMPLTVDQLTGYVDRGLDADLARWFPDEPGTDVPASTRSVEPFLARLPGDAATALAGFDRRVRAGALPARLDLFVWSIVRYHAVRAGILDLAAVEDDFRALGQPGALAPGVGLLAAMSS